MHVTMGDNTIVAGVDEAGRGCLAGPVVAAAVILPREVVCDPQLQDSKKLSPCVRNRLERIIKELALAWSLGVAWPREIDRMNILQATLQAMSRAVNKLRVQPELVLVDGNQLPPVSVFCRCIPGGDGKVPQISAASILAKVFRDRLMEHLDRRYPGYGFQGHKGYGTRDHVHQLQVLGPCRMHRRSFGPVRRLLEDRQQWLPGI
ncbi:MAG: ribonuclease HII [Desulfovermiculus sp.]|nr:ribonuclease HII [Desulfovermiculus sp.]